MIQIEQHFRKLFHHDSGWATPIIFMMPCLHVYHCFHFSILYSLIYFLIYFFSTWYPSQIPSNFTYSKQEAEQFSVQVLLLSLISSMMLARKQSYIKLQRRKDRNLCPHFVILKIWFHCFGLLFHLYNYVRLKDRQSTFNFKIL